MGRHPVRPIALPLAAALVVALAPASAAAQRMEREIAAFGSADALVRIAASSDGFVHLAATRQIAAPSGAEWVTARYVGAQVIAWTDSATRLLSLPVKAVPGIIAEYRTHFLSSTEGVRTSVTRRIRNDSSSYDAHMRDGDGIEVALPLSGGEVGEFLAALRAAAIVALEPPNGFGAPPARDSVVAADTTGERTYSDNQVEKRALPYPDNPVPRYPVGLLRAGVQGEVLTRFVVTPEGRVDPRSFRILRSSHDSFTAAVRDIIHRLRYYAAELDDRAVRQETQQVFVFRVKK